MSRILIAVTLSLLLGVAVAGETLEVRVAEGTRWETRAFVRAAERAGPTVWVVGGMHGNEAAGWRAARIVRGWPVASGKLVVLPRANAAGVAKGTRRVPAEDPFDLNRCFPSKKGGRVSGALAKSIWRLAKEHPPDWIVDLHESVDYSYRATKERKHLGNTVIVRTDAMALAISRMMATAADAHVFDRRCRFRVLRGPIEGSLARAAATRLGARAMIVETCRKDHLAVRVAEHRLAVHRLLSELNVTPVGFSAETFFPEKREKGEVRVGIYNSTGTGMSSAFQVERCLPEEAGYACRRLTGRSIRYGALDRFDVVVFPGGAASSIAETLEREGRERVRKFVRGGGGYLGICAGAYLATRHYSWSLGVLDAKVLDTAHWDRGQADLRIAFTPAGRELFGRKAPTATVRYNQGPILAPGGDEAIPDYEVLAVYETEVAKKGAPKGVMPGTPALVRGTFGRGRVAAFGPHPESSKDASLRKLVERAVRWLAGGE